MSKFLIGNAYLALAILCAAASQVTLKALLNNVGIFEPHWSFVEHVALVGRIWQLILMLGLFAAGALLWVMSLSRLDLSYAYSIACGSAVIVALLSTIFLDESVSPRMWLGIVLIVVGTLLLVPSR